MRQSENNSKSVTWDQMPSQTLPDREIFIVTFIIIRYRKMSINVLSLTV